MDGRGTKYYDPETRRVVYAHEAPTPEFWDAAWRRELARRNPYSPPPKRSMIVRETQRWLPKGSLVLEGGCGLGFHSWHLVHRGYRTIALDNCPETVAFLQRERPQIDPRLGDVRNLALESGTVDGYWSLGVIEHFPEGYDEIMSEMARVIRPGGFLFLTFPQTNAVRATLGALGHFPDWTSAPDSTRHQFYQFALRPNEVAADLERHSFSVVRKRSFLALTGLEDTFPSLGRHLKHLRGRSLASRILGYALDIGLQPWTAHMSLLIAQRARLSS